MSPFKKEEFVAVVLPDLSAAARDIGSHFEQQGFSVAVEPSLLGATEIALHKPGIFRAVLGMKTALKISLEPVAGGTQIRAEIGIWGQQAMPTVLMLFVAWPVVLTQIWGLVQQSKLDDEAVRVARETLHKHNGKALDGTALTPTSKLCPHCGHVLPDGGKFCPGCGVADTFKK